MFEQISKFENLVLRGHFLGMAHINIDWILVAHETLPW